MRIHLDTVGSASFNFGILVEQDFPSFSIVMSNYTRRLLASLAMKKEPCTQKLGLICVSLGRLQEKGKLRNVILNFTSLTATSFPLHTQVNEFLLLCYFLLSFIHFPLFTTFSNFNLNELYSSSTFSPLSFQIPFFFPCYLCSPKLPTYSFLLFIINKGYCNYSQ